MPENYRVSTRLQGHLRIISRAGWLILVATLLVPFAVGIPLRFNHLMQLARPEDLPLVTGLPPELETTFTARLGVEEAEALRTLGMSQSAYAGYILFFDIALVILGTAAGFLIFWRRSENWIALWISSIVIFIGTNGVSLVTPTLGLVWPSWFLLSMFLGFFGMVSNLYIFFLFPDGQFVPQWTQRIAAGFTGLIVGISLYVTFIILKYGAGQAVSVFIAVFFSIVILIWLGLLGVGIASQIYRYQRVSGSTQRQQTKWVAVGLAAVTLGVVINSGIWLASSQVSGLQRVAWNLVRAPLVNLFLGLLPMTLAFSIFRYKLWDIDLIIRRTIIYGTLTAFVGTIYFGGIVLFQSIFTGVGGQQPEIVIVLSTLAIAALFNPLRRRVQDFIDRRFYRKKYNAEQALARFATIARDEVDMDKLAEALIGVVEETVQPERVSLWLKEK